MNRKHFRIRPQRIRRGLRRREQGMTLVEIMIVVIIMALIATAVGVAVLPRLKQANTATEENPSGFDVLD